MKIYVFKFTFRVLQASDYVKFIFDTKLPWNFNLQAFSLWFYKIKLASRRISVLKVEFPDHKELEYFSFIFTYLNKKHFVICSHSYRLFKCEKQSKNLIKKMNKTLCSRGDEIVLRVLRVKWKNINKGLFKIQKYFVFFIVWRTFESLKLSEQFWLDFCFNFFCDVLSFSSKSSLCGSLETYVNFNVWIERTFWEFIT